ncbi:uncharacterized protein CTRU02_206605 [Colletotrichum truncatum]|uniref:Uncharacterized protein n=1 Tax=Colletotrichum truncatum TaxID=5467 RepID=A0ACC3Z7G3_COLTU
MAEPVGITGTAVGLVSLGLQLYGEISKYVNAVKGRKGELDSARRHAETMQKCINAIDDATSSRKNANATTNEAVDICVNSCINELKALEAVVLSLKDPDAGADTLSSRLKGKGKQVAYPFHREKLLELEKRMISTNEVLQTALHAFGM